MEFAILTFVLTVLDVGITIWAVLYARKAHHRIDSTWDYLMRRAMAEGLIKGLATMNSPMIITDEVRGWYAPFATELREWYRRSGRYRTEREMFEDVNTMFGSKFLDKICIEHNLQAGFCIAAAIEIARST